jgi:hypothetical protein
MSYRLIPGGRIMYRLNVRLDNNNLACHRDRQGQIVPDSKRLSRCLSWDWLVGLSDEGGDHGAQVIIAFNSPTSFLQRITLVSGTHNLAHFKFCWYPSIEEVKGLTLHTNGLIL